jgi:hypothetical protein
MTAKRKAKRSILRSMERRRHLPRKLKKAIQRWLDEPYYRLRGRTRQQFLRWHNKNLREQGMLPIRRLPDGRVSLFDLI